MSVDWLKSVNKISKGKLVPTALKDLLINDPKVYAERILKEEAVTASITMPINKLSSDGKSLVTETVTIPFYMENDFSISNITNKWSDIVNFDSLGPIAGMINQLVSAPTGSAQITLQSEAMSTKCWQGSDFGGFSVNCLFLCTNRRINPTKIIRTLAAGALPTKANGDSTGTVESLRTQGVKLFNKLFVCICLSSACCCYYKL